MPTLVIMAAGIGSRYGGLKQIDPVGPHQQIILDYSVYDALQAGFGKVVFVIRKEIEAVLKEFIGGRYEKDVPCEYAYQELDALPPGYSIPANREKPWGTGHAVLVCESVVDEPFCVINADDFYGRTAYREMVRFLSNADTITNIPNYAMVGFSLPNTLSYHGSVSRGICRIGPDGHLVSVTERTNIEKTPEGIQYQDEHGVPYPLTADEAVSLNFWGFTPSLFSHLHGMFRGFLEEEIDDPKAEFLLPSAIDHLISTKQTVVTVLTSSDRWIGVTYQDDKADVSSHLDELVQAGVYPEKLW
ncbi:MAG: nucleotidyltransferase [Desulfobacterales bacterium C00003060]|nr:MAG: nucleotidyltransferase [Desulfobacterales bacterium C00003060]